MMQARDTLSTDFKSMVSQVESNAGMQVGFDMPPGALTACSACQVPCPCAGACQLLKSPSHPYGALRRCAAAPLCLCTQAASVTLPLPPTIVNTMLTNFCQVIVSTREQEAYKVSVLSYKASPPHNSL